MVLMFVPMPVCRFLWRHCEPWQRQQMYFFSSYFFTQLKPPRDKTLTAQERYARVARWTQKETDLFNKRFLFIPINDRYGLMLPG